MIDLLFEYLQDGVYYTLSKSALFLLLFIIIIVVPYLFNNWKRILVACFVLTIGHVFGLIFNSFDVLNPNYRLIELILILITLAVGLLNIFTSGKKSIQKFKGTLYLVAFCFGLCHGLGFSEQMDQWVSTSNSLWLAIAFTSLGIFIGQLIIGFITVFLSFICQTIFRFSKRDWVMVISAIIIGSLIPSLF